MTEVRQGHKYSFFGVEVIAMESGERVKVRERAERALSQAADALATGTEVVGGVVVERIASSPAAESGELPLLLHRVTVTSPWFSRTMLSTPT